MAFDPETRMEGIATLVASSTGEIQLVVSSMQSASVVATSELVLLQGLAKGDKIDAVVRDATELGATRVVLVEAARSVVRLEGRRKDDRRARLVKISEEAARQCGRSDPPQIVGPLPLLEAISHAPEGGRFALSPTATDKLGRELHLYLGAPLTFAIGPEGGLTTEELDLLDRHGFTMVSIGPFVLRTETVAACVLGAVRVLGDAQMG